MHDHSGDDGPWSLSIYRVSSRRHQQEILRTLRDSHRPDVHALGAGVEPDPGPHVIVECRCPSDESYARRVVLDADPMAEHVHVTHQPGR